MASPNKKCPRPADGEANQGQYYYGRRKIQSLHIFYVQILKDFIRVGGLPTEYTFYTIYGLWIYGIASSTPKICGQEPRRGEHLGGMVERLGKIPVIESYLEDPPFKSSVLVVDFKS